MSEYGPPFDNPEWSERKEEIKKILLEPIDWLKGYIYYLIAKDLFAALEAEESDTAMFARSLAEIYDELSFGRISKPNTKPFEVVRIVNERIDDAYHEGYNDGRSDEEFK